MSQVVMNELVNMSQEIIKLKDEKRELMTALEGASNYVNLLGGDARQYKQLIAKIQGKPQ